MGGDWKRVSCHGNRIFIVIGVFPVELLACPVSMVWYNIGLSVGYHQSSHLHILCIAHFSNFISLKLIQVFANGKRCFYSSMEFYLIQLKNEELKI